MLTKWKSCWNTQSSAAHPAWLWHFSWGTNSKRIEDCPTVHSSLFLHYRYYWMTKQIQLRALPQDSDLRNSQEVCEWGNVMNIQRGQDKIRYRRTHLWKLKCKTRYGKQGCPKWAEKEEEVLVQGRCVFSTCLAKLQNRVMGRVQRCAIWLYNVLHH